VKLQELVVEVERQEEQEELVVVELLEMLHLLMVMQEQLTQVEVEVHLLLKQVLLYKLLVELVVLVW
jgi:hypothetical protein